jgi:hypothetical protein
VAFDFGCAHAQLLPAALDCRFWVVDQIQRSRRRSVATGVRAYDYDSITVLLIEHRCHTWFTGLATDCHEDEDPLTGEAAAESAGREPVELGLNPS